ncbi:MAG: choice-of-anchor D domain-containing protein [Verrucomicrobiae bacterium]|nr:choice-of-anchor D domain-containing protein [Verrucomicrobiae bacterium]
MKAKIPAQALPWARLILLPLALCARSADAADAAGGAIPFSEIGARAGSDYTGDALGIRPEPGGAHLRCGFQKLEGRATPEGLWLTSTEDGARLRLIATEIGRAGDAAPAPLALRPAGEVRVSDKLVSFLRPGLTEEYTVSVDGLRQDFILEEPPPGEGELRIGLALGGARARAAAHGAILALDGTGRELAYSRLCVQDATGRDLPARIEVAARDRLQIVVADAGAAYPVRIDPTFSDADWSNLGATTTASGANGPISAAAVVGSDVYVGGSFSFIGNTPARNVARWNGSSWSPLGTPAQNGVSSIVNAIAATSTNAIYVGGFFATVADASTNSISANRIALWTGSSWSRLGSATQNGAGNEVRAIAALSSNAVYVGGTFTNVADASSPFTLANRIALWNGSSWSPLGTPTQNGAGSDVRAIAAVSSNAVYVGGTFTNVADASSASIAARRVALWNGTSWSPLGTPSQNGVGGAGISDSVSAIAALSTGAVYVGGFFTNVADASSPSLSANRIARWNGSSWSRLGSATQNGAGSTVSAIAALATNAVYVGGAFTTVADASSASISARYIALWNGSAWSRLGTASQNGPGSQINVIAALSSNAVYVGGLFTTVADASNASIGASRIVRWDATTSRWSPTPAADGGASDTVNALATAGADLYVGGSFTRIGSTNANRIARWNGSQWFPLGTATQNGASDVVFSITPLSTNAIYVGGQFTTVADSSSPSISARRIALWNGSSWSRLGTPTQNGADGQVLAIAALSTSAVYVGGFFTTVADASTNSISANRVALWNGSSWSRLGTPTQNGAGGTINAIAALSSNAVYVGGNFTNVADASSSFTLANRLALWNGSSWSPLGSATQNGAGSSVNAIAALSSNAVYVGGSFTTVADASTNSISANRIAFWNGSSWSRLGTPTQNGAGSSVSAITALSTNAVYVGGLFTTVADASSSSISANRIALWNGGTARWAALGGGVDSSVNALATDGYHWLYAGGSFLSAGTNLFTVSPGVVRGHIRTEIDIEQPAGIGLTNGATRTLGNVVVGDITNITITIRNTGSANLVDPSDPPTGFAITFDGPNTSEFGITSYPTTPIAPGATGTFTVQFSPTNAGVKTVVLHIPSNDEDESPYDINLTGSAFGFSDDTDGDGLNDGSEVELAALGFSPTSNQVSMVTALFNNLGGMSSNLNSAGYFTESQVQGLNVSPPRLRRDPATGEFTLTIELEKSEDLESYYPFPLTAPQTTIDGAGNLQVQFTVPGDAAFFELRAD